MPNQQPILPSADGKRQFALSPAAVVVFILNENEEFLLLQHPRRNGLWECVSGALEKEESALEGALREAYEELGAAMELEALGALHISTFRYDEDHEHMLSLAFLMAYRGGGIMPGDDMREAETRWWALEEMDVPGLAFLPPLDQRWLRQRAVECYRMWQANPPGMNELQRDGDAYDELYKRHPKY